MRKSNHEKDVWTIMTACVWIEDYPSHHKYNRYVCFANRHQCILWTATGTLKITEWTLTISRLKKQKKLIIKITVDN